MEETVGHGGQRQQKRKGRIMIIRLILVGLGLVLASQAVLLGEILAPFSPAQMVQVEEFPWLWLERVEVGEGWYFPAFVAVVGIVALFTVIAMLDVTVGLLATKTQYVSRGDIVTFIFILAIGAGLYGMVASPFAANGMSLEMWFLQWPQSIPAWVLLAPLLLVLLNLLREVDHAVGEYEVKARGGDQVNREVRESLNAMANQVQVLSVQISELEGPDSQIAATRNDVKALMNVSQGIYTALRDIAKIQSGMSKQMQEQLGGVFPLLRRLEVRLAAGQRLQPVQPNVEEPLPGEPAVVGEPVAAVPPQRAGDGGAHEWHDGVRLRQPLRLQPGR